VNLVERGSAEKFTEAVKAAYQQRFGILADVFVCDAVDGAWLRNKGQLGVGA
jgi:galactokinase